MSYKQGKAIFKDYSNTELTQFIAFQKPTATYFDQLPINNETFCKKDPIKNRSLCVCICMCVYKCMYMCVCGACVIKIDIIRTSVKCPLINVIL